MRWWWLWAFAGCGGQEPKEVAAVVTEPVPAPEPQVVELPSDPVWPSDPDADYPLITEDETARLMMEEPDRGPLVRQDLPALPSGLTVTRHTHCQLLVPTLTCSEPLVESNGAAPWVVHRKGPVVHMAIRQLYADDQHNVWRWVYDEMGGLKQLHTRSHSNRVLRTITFSDDEMFYRARERSGANGLDGCGIWNVEDDFDGRIIVETCLGWNGAPQADGSGIVTRLHTFDDAGFVSETRYTTADGVAMASSSGVATLRFERDGSGRVVAEHRLDVAGKPVASSEDGCAGMRFAFAPHGDTASATCLGADGEPSADSAGVVTRQYSYGDDRQMSSMVALGADGERVDDRMGVSERQYAFDVLGRVVSESCLNKEQQPAGCVPGGAQHIVTRYPYRNDSNERRYEMAGGSMAGDPDYGVARVYEAMDGYGRLEHWDCRDASGQNIECGGTGVARFEQAFDDAGRVVRIRFFDVAGAPTSNMGTTERRLSYDPYDRVTEVRELGDGRTALSYAAQRFTYDASGNLAAMHLFNEDYAPASFPHCFAGMQCPDAPWHAMRVVRAPNGAVTSNVFYDALGHRVAELSCEGGRCWE